jgi:TRAP-type mannitol/chloroaromatic compound transport system permease small subunit
LIIFRQQSKQEKSTKPWLMVSTLRKVAQAIHTLNEHVGRAAAWLTTLLMLLVCFDVVVRYLFNETQAWIMELEWHLFGLIFLLGAGYAFRHDRHVRVDLFYAKFSAKDKALVNLIGGLIFLIPWTAILIYVSFEYATIAYKIGEGSPDPGGLPARYIIKYAITAGMGLLFLQGLASIIDNWLVFKGEKPSSLSITETE